MIQDTVLENHVSEQSDRRDEIRLTRRNRIITVLVVIFFASIIFLYYHMLYEAKRSSIIREGEVSAEESADELEQYLSTNIDSIKLSAYTLDDMIEKGSSEQEIQSFLVGQSTAIKSAVMENATGLYGYINGRFYSGTNWNPPEGYNATKRPWYTRPMENPGEITILDPYVDVQSGNTMLALGKTLSDGVSVISVDVSLDRVQNLMEEAVERGYSDIEMVLNEKGIVIAHSDPAENGKNYYEETDTLGSNIIYNLECPDRNNYEFRFQGEHYIVYVAHIQDKWHCISVRNVSRVFGILNMILFATIGVVILLGAIISIIIHRTNHYYHMSAMAIAASEAKSSFLSNMSHEIRTPINAILGMNEMILRESRERAILTYAQNIRNAGRNLMELVNGILDFSRIEAGEVDLHSSDRDALETTEQANADSQTIRYRERFNAPDAHILVVDDNPMNLIVFQSLVKKTGVKIDTAENGDEGIDLCKKRRYDIIFLDHMMPGKDGIETLAAIRNTAQAFNKGTPCICLTANAINGSREKYLAAGFDEYLSKPIDPARLEELMLFYLPQDKVVKYETAEKTPLRPIPADLEPLSASGMDVIGGIENSGGEKEYRVLLKMFYDSAEAKAKELEESYAASDFANYTVRVHAMKSSAKIIGAAAFGEEAQNLEDAGKSGDVEYIREHHEKFLKDLFYTADLLNGMFRSGAEKEEKQLADPVLMKEVFSELLAASEEMDCDLLESIFDEMDSYRIPARDKTLYEKIRSAVKNYDYETIVTLIRKGEEQL